MVRQTLAFIVVVAGLTLGSDSSVGSSDSAGTQRPDQVQQISDAELDRLLAESRPPDELWETIPWQVSVLEARKLAVEEGKPLFMSVLGGQMLACG